MVSLCFQISRLFIIVNHSLFYCRDNSQVLGLCGWSLLFGSLVYTIYGAALPQDNVDIKTSSHINNNNPYEVKQVHPSSDLPNASPEPVIFEPIRNITLSRATYKVTSYINFEPYLLNFMKFNEYLQAFKTDLKDERKMGTLMDMNPRFLLEGTDRDCTQDMRNNYETLQCKFYRQYLRILKEVTIIEELLIYTPKISGCHRSFGLLSSVH